MFISFAICMGLIGHMTMAVPLEKSSPDLASSSAPALEIPPSDLTQYFNPRIVGGSEAQLGENPSMVALVVGWQFKSFVCGASLVSNKCAVTAAHCIMVDWQGHMLESSHGIVGTNTWNRGGIVLIFRAHKIHSEYNPITIKNDLAVLYLETPVQFNEKIQPMCVHFGWVDGGVKTKVTGWGRLDTWGIIPNHLQVLYTTTLSHQKCEKLIASIAHLWWSIPPRDHRTEIATFVDEGFGMCNGDSGSALILVKTGCQVGVVSWGFPCAAGGPDMFTRLSAFDKWLNQATCEGKC